MGVFAIESWPDHEGIGLDGYAAGLTPMGATLTDERAHGRDAEPGRFFSERANGPHVRAGGLEDTLAHLPRQDLDMVIWARTPPGSWADAMRCFSSPGPTLRLKGTIETVSQAIRDLPQARAYPDFLLEDVVQSASLTAALSGSNRLSLSLACGNEVGILEPGGRMSLLCAYGHDAVGWESGPVLSGGQSTGFAPFSLAFIPGREEARLRLSVDHSRCGPVLFLRVE